MERADSTNKILALIRAGLAERLGEQGYQVVHTKNDDNLYSSYYVIWSNDQEMIRLTWDGLENVFQLDTSGDLPLSSGSSWLTISVTAFDSTHDELDYLHATASKVVNSLT